MTELHWMPAVELASLIRQRKLSPVELVDSVLAQLEAVNPAINAFVTVTAEQAREQAKAATDQLMRTPVEELGALHGIPVTVKDLTDTAGVQTTYGIADLKGHVPDTDAVAWARMKAAGAILIGKTTTPEFGMTGICESRLTGVTSNPWNIARTSGGSSGGAAASLAAGIAPLAWGSDGGGSIRVPAACCGVVGHKASAGRIPAVRPGEFPNGVDVEGPLARTVADTALLLGVTAGPHPLDPISLPSDDSLTVTLRKLAAGEVPSLRNVRIAYTPHFGTNAEQVDPAVTVLVEQALRLLETELGAVVERIEMQLPDTHQYFMDYWGPQYAVVVDGLAEMIPGFDTTTLWPFIQECARYGRTRSAAELVDAATYTRGEIADAFSQVLAGYDLLITPTIAVPATLHPSGTDDPALAAGGLLHMLTEPPSHAGMPAVTVNCGFTPNGLPAGMQIIGPRYADAAILKAAAAYQAATTWHTQRPQLADMPSAASTS
jgi:Asp-tRNA(Asn)/Glu-tRNA(Gln) amidotransferase A subunit family amidase